MYRIQSIFKVIQEKKGCKQKFLFKLTCITVLKNGFWVAATTEIASLKPLTILTF